MSVYVCLFEGTHVSDSALHTHLYRCAYLDTKYIGVLEIVLAQMHPYKIINVQKAEPLRCVPQPNGATGA